MPMQILATFSYLSNVPLYWWREWNTSNGYQAYKFSRRTHSKTAFIFGLYKVCGLCYYHHYHNREFLILNHLSKWFQVIPSTLISNPTTTFPNKKSPKMNNEGPLGWNIFSLLQSDSQEQLRLSPGQKGAFHPILSWRQRGPGATAAGRSCIDRSPTDSTSDRERSRWCRLSNAKSHGSHLDSRSLADLNRSPIQKTTWFLHSNRIFFVHHRMHARRKLYECVMSWLTVRGL